VPGDQNQKIHHEGTKTRRRAKKGEKKSGKNAFAASAMKMSV
jgi:hypothetical protein